LSAGEELLDASKGEQNVKSDLWSGNPLEPLVPPERLSPAGEKHLDRSGDHASAKSQPPVDLVSHPEEEAESGSPTRRPRSRENGLVPSAPTLLPDSLPTTRAKLLVGLEGAKSGGSAGKPSEPSPERLLSPEKTPSNGSAESAKRKQAQDAVDQRDDARLSKDPGGSSELSDYAESPASDKSLPRLGMLRTPRQRGPSSASEVDLGDAHSPSEQPSPISAQGRKLSSDSSRLPVGKTRALSAQVLLSARRPAEVSGASPQITTREGDRPVQGESLLPSQGISARRPKPKSAQGVRSPGSPANEEVPRRHRRSQQSPTPNPPKNARIRDRASAPLLVVRGEDLALRQHSSLIAQDGSSTGHTADTASEPKGQSHGSLVSPPSAPNDEPASDEFVGQSSDFARETTPPVEIAATLRERESGRTQRASRRTARPAVGEIVLGGQELIDEEEHVFALAATRVVQNKQEGERRPPSVGATRGAAVAFSQPVVFLSTSFSQSSNPL
jgi:hypothetical protein